MNFTPYGTPFTGSLPAGHQFTTTKLAHQIGSAGNQVLGLISLDESGVTYLRPVDMNGALTLNVPTNSGNNATQNQQIITLPISIPGSKPGEISSQQTLQILVNPGNDKYQCVPLSLQHFQQGALTVAYSNAQQGGEGIQLQVQSQDENGTVDHTTQTQQDDQSNQQHNNNNNNNDDDGPPHTVQIQHGMQTEEMVLPDVKPILTEASVATGESGGTTQAYPVAVVAQMPPELILREDVEQDKNGQQKDSGKERRGEDVSLIIGGENYNISSLSSWQSLATGNQSLGDYLSRMSNNTPLPLSLHHFLKFSADTIKREATVEASPLQADGDSAMATSTGTQADGDNQEDIDPQSPAVASTMVDYLSRIGGPAGSAGLPFSLHHFLTFPADAAAASATAVKREPADGKSRTAGADAGADAAADNAADEVDPQSGKPKKKKKYKKKAPKPRRPRPGQVHIATALDGTTLFCCPECNMAYSAKDLLEQHLVSHKIERRFICDICGAGLKRKEHLERHKLGHNPERPYICSVCCKGFKRKEHLNLHFVIHSGEKTEVCGECGKGFYRKDHLRKHARSHLTKRVRDEINQQQAAAQLVQQVQQGQQTMTVDEQGQVQTGDQQQHQETTVVLPTAAETGAGITILHQQQQQQQQQHEESMSHHVITLDNFQVEEPCEENT